MFHNLSEISGYAKYPIMHRWFQLLAGSISIGSLSNSKVRGKIDLLYVSELRQFEMPSVADFSGSLGIQPF